MKIINNLHIVRALFKNNGAENSYCLVTSQPSQRHSACSSHVFAVMLVWTSLLRCQTYKSTVHAITYRTYFLKTITHNYIAVFTILHFIMLQCTLSTYKKNVCCTTMPCYAGSSHRHFVFAPSLDCNIFSCTWFNLMLFFIATCNTGL